MTTPSLISAIAGANRFEDAVSRANPLAEALSRANPLGESLSPRSLGAALSPGPLGASPGSLGATLSPGPLGATLSRPTSIFGRGLSPPGVQSLSRGNQNPGAREADRKAARVRAVRETTQANRIAALAFYDEPQG